MPHCKSQPVSTGAAVYQRRRPERSLLHKTVRENLETFLSVAEANDDFTHRVPPHVEAAYRNYLKCGILAHGFARAYCDGCGHDFMIAFSCKGRDICPSCATRRMVETAAHMVDHVLPRVQFRQWVLSVPKRVRWHMRAKPEVTSGLLTVFLRAVETTLRQRSPGVPASARFGAVAFVHRFGSTLNRHVHYHVLVTDGVFSASDHGSAEFHPATELADHDFLTVQTKMRKRGLRWLHRHGHLDDVAVHTLDNLDHAGGWSVDGSVVIPGWDRHGLERLVRYCARPSMSGDRLGRLNADTLVYRLRKPTFDGRMELVLTPLELMDRLSKLVTPPRIHKHRYCGVQMTLTPLELLGRLSKLVTPPRIHKHRYCGVLAPNAKLRKSVIESAGPAGATLQLLTEAREKMGLDDSVDEEPAPNPLRRAAARCWALLLVRIYECLPLLCPSCGQPMRIIAFLEDPPVVEKILLHIGEPTQAPELLPARAPPQTELDFGQVGAEDQADNEWPEMDQTAGETETWD